MEAVQRAGVAAAAVLVVVLGAAPAAGQDAGDARPRDGRVVCESPELVRASEDVVRKKGLGAWRQWLAGTDGACQDAEAGTVYAEPSGESYRGEPIMCIRSGRWDGCLYMLRSDLTWIPGS